MNWQTAEAAIKLYKELADLDRLLAAMQEKQTYKPTPLQKVTFYQCTSTYSGPRDYTPKHREKVIARAIIADMNDERVRIAGEIEAIGFVAHAYGQ